MFFSNVINKVKGLLGFTPAPLKSQFRGTDPANWLVALGRSERTPWPSPQSAEPVPGFLVSNEFLQYPEMGELFFPTAVCAWLI